MADSADLTGQKVGEYEISARIGVGGMGAVYEGRQPLIGKRVAVKVLLPQLSADKELVERFLSEARAVNEIRHRGIVDIFSFGQLPSGEHYFVMEMLQGSAFDKLIKQSAPLPFAQALAWVEETCDALQAAHETGIIHRDIKPSNIFLVDTGRGRPYVKLLDFGIAKLGALKGEATPQTRASVVIGTPDYMSPEQARGKPISPATDLYALGCVLFELVTGRRPFKGENSLQTMFMHVEEPAPAASTFNPSVMPELDQLILWTMEKDPAARPASAEELRLACEALRGEMVSEAPTGPRTPIPSGSRTPSKRTPSVRTPAPKAATPSPRSSRQGPVHTPVPAKSTGQTSGWRVQGAGSVGPSTAIGSPHEVNLESDTGLEPIDATIPKKIVPLKVDETRVKPLTDPGVELTGPTTRTPIPPPRAPRSGKVPPVTTPELEPELTVPKSKMPLVAAMLGLAVVAAGITLFVLNGRESSDTVPTVQDIPLKPVITPPEVVPVQPVDTKPVDTKPVDTKPVDTKPVDTKPADTKPADTKPADTKPADTKPPDIHPPTNVTDVKPPEPKHGGGLTAAALESRISRLDAKLAQKEAKKGEQDRVMRQFLSGARSDAKAADSDAKRREVWKNLDEIQHQLDAE